MRNTNSNIFLYFCICIVFVYLYFICVFVFPTLLSWDSGDHAAVSGQHPHLSSCAGGQGWKCLDLFKLPNIFSLNAKLFLTTCKMCCVTIRICPVTNCACGRSDRVGNVAQSAKKVHFYIYKSKCILLRFRKVNSRTPILTFLLFFWTQVSFEGVGCGQCCPAWPQIRMDQVPLPDW